jgi:hypothetical protein
LPAADEHPPAAGIGAAEHASFALFLPDSKNTITFTETGSGQTEERLIKKKAAIFGRSTQTQLMATHLRSRFGTSVRGKCRWLGR